MSRNSLLVVVVVVLIGSVMWFLKSASDMKRTLTAASLASSGSVASSAEPAVAAVGNASTGTGGGSAAARTTSPIGDNVSNTEALATLQTQLATEQQRLEEQRRLLTELQARQAAQVAPAAYGQQVAQNQAEIRDLGEDMQATRQQEARVDATATQALMAQNTATRQGMAQVDEDIRLVEAELQTTMGLISSWPNNMPSGVSPQTRMQQLQVTQADQQARLQQLRAQRNEMNVAMTQQSQAVQGWSAQAKDQLVSTQDAIQNQIISLREEIVRLQGAQNQSRESVMTLGSQVSQVQKDIDAQNQQVQALQNGVQTQQGTTAPSSTVR